MAGTQPPSIDPAMQQSSPSVEPAMRRSPSSSSGCLKEEWHGSPRGHRGLWNLYDGRGEPAPQFLLEHTGTHQASGHDIQKIRSSLASADFLSGNVHSLAVGACAQRGDTRIGHCLEVSILPNADPLEVASRVDSALRASEQDTCFGVAVFVSEMARPF